jgi:transcriptional regulator with XRE-family HTH domain
MSCFCDYNIIERMMILEFKDRLKNYRLSLNIKTKVAMSEKLGIARTLYTMLENGTREPSKDVLEKLFLLSGKPEEYWLYGIEDDEYISKRKEFKCLKDAVNQLMQIGLLKSEKDYDKPTVHEVLDAAMRADVIHLIEKNNK